MRFGFTITRQYHSAPGVARFESIAWRHYESSYVRDHFLFNELAAVRLRYPSSQISHVSWQFLEVSDPQPS